MFVRLSQQILSGKLLLAVTGGQKSNLSGGFKIRTNNNLPPDICCESVVKMLWTLLDVICYLLILLFVYCYICFVSLFWLNQIFIHLNLSLDIVISLVWLVGL